MNYSEALSYINSFSKSGSSVKDLSRISMLLEKLDTPQDSLKFVHIAGTNGKGSTLEMISEALISAGYSVGQLTSPFIRHYRDRIRINSQEISENNLCAICEKVKSIVMKLENKADFSQFEITMAIAFLYFVNEKVDIVCLEAGIGGMLDATNIIKRPLVSVITSISLDHTEILGDTIEKITIQKSGIIKESCPVVLYPENSSATFDIIKKAAGKMDSLLIIPDINSLENESSDMSGSSFEYKNEKYSVGMAGIHQIYNAVTAIEALKILKSKNFNIAYKDIYRGLKSAKVNARMEILNKGPLVIFDGAHNPGGIDKLLKSSEIIAKKPLIGVAGMLKSKDYVSAVNRISAAFNAVICVDGFYPTAVKKETLAEEFEKTACKAYTARLDDAISVARIMAGADGAVIVFGSLYLYSEINNA